MPEQTLCEQCGKESAMVFVLTKQGDSEREQALCLRCAEKRKTPSVKEFIRRQRKPDTAIQMCEICGGLPAMVHVAVNVNGKEQEKRALCGFCAREQNIPQVEVMLAQSELSDEALLRLHEDYLQQAQAPKGILQKLRRIFKG